MEEWETSFWDLSSSLLHSAMRVQVENLDDTSVECKKHSSAASFENFPDMLVITSKGHTATMLTRYMGGYFKMPNVVKNGRLVWEQIGSENYIFYDYQKLFFFGGCLGMVMTEQQSCAKLPGCPSPSPAESFACPHNWFAFQEFYFSVWTHNLSSMEADKVCQAVNGNLASIHNEDENAFVSMFLTSGHFWIGGSNMNFDGQWQWTARWKFMENAFCWRSPSDGHGGPGN